MNNLIYIRKCLGMNGELVNIYKIRTMVPDADAQLEALVANGFDSFGKIINDPRITPVGRILRKYWIDELPQLYNLAMGDIKLVGIRPKSEASWKIYPSELVERSLRQKPGLLAIEYAFAYTDRFEDKLDHMDVYLNKWEKNPQNTDRTYFSMIVRNIIVGGIRSK